MTVFRVAAAVLALAAALLPMRAPAAPPTQITVTGQGTESGTPDMASLEFSIMTNADSAERATSQNNAVFARLQSALGALGIAGADIRTTSYNLNYNPPPATGGPPQPTTERYGYFVYRGIGVTLRDTSAVGKAIDAAVGAGVNNVGGVAFGLRDRGAQVARALQSAVIDARKKAEAMAAAAGLHIVGVRTMQYGTPMVFQPRPVYNVAMSAAPPTQILPQSVEVQANVTVTYDAR